MRFGAMSRVLPFGTPAHDSEPPHLFKVAFAIQHNTTANEAGAGHDTGSVIWSFTL
jgi:hypothetical protein